MSSTDIVKTIHHAKGLLDTEWCLWQQYISGKKSKNTYGNNLDCIFDIGSLRDLAGLWTRTSYCKVSVFFETANTTEAKR